MRLEGTATVVLVRLDLPEVITVPLIEAVLAVELKAAAVGNVVIRERLRVAGSQGRQLRAVELAGILVHPHQLLDRVVQRQVEADRLRGHRLLKTILKLVDEVLVRLLGEAATLVRVEVDVIHIHRRILEAGQGRSRPNDSTREGTTTRRDVLDQVRRLAEDEVQANLVVLEGDERQSQTRVAAEPEGQRDIQNRRAAVAASGRRERALNRGTQHLVETNRLVILRGQRLPQIHPLTIVTVHDLATDLNLHLLDEEVTQTATTTGRPEHVLCRTRGSRTRVGKRHLEIRAEHQVSITVDDHNRTLAIRRRTREVDTHGLHGEIGMTLVQHLPEGDVGISGDVGILSTICDELKKTAAHCVYLLRGYILVASEQWRVANTKHREQTPVSISPTWPVPGKAKPYGMHPLERNSSPVSLAMNTK